MDLARASRRTARKKGSGYENGPENDDAFMLACVAGPQFYGGPDLQRAGFWRAWGRIEGLQ
jgi:hypothetical protein